MIDIDPFTFAAWEDEFLITKVTDDLWMGGYWPDVVLPDEVKHYVSVFAGGRYLVNHELMSERLFNLQDLDHSSALHEKEVLQIADWINGCRKTGLTFVHCQGGFNRSGLVVATALVKSGMKPREAIDMLRTKRSRWVLFNKTFENFVLCL